MLPFGVVLGSLRGSFKGGGLVAEEFRGLGFQGFRVQSSGV